MKASGGRFYQRLFAPLIVVWCLIFQRLNADHSLDAVVSHVSSGAVDHPDDRDRLPVSERIESESTAAYGKARKRIPLAVLKGVACRSAQAAEEQLDAEARRHGHAVAPLDATTLVMRPEAELVEHYGQARNQHGLAYWVVMRVVAAFGLHTAVLPVAADGPHRESEQSLAKRVLAQLAPNGVCVGDSNSGVFSVAQAARRYNLSVLLRLLSGPSRGFAFSVLQDAPPPASPSSSAPASPAPDSPSAS